VLQSEQIAVVTKGPWLGRDGFVAETAIQFDKVQASIARLERELAKSQHSIGEISEEANRTRRFQAFEETLKNSRDYKITDMQRGYRDLKARLDAIEGEKSTFVGLTYKSFEPIDKKLAELTRLQEQVGRSQKAVHRTAMLFAVTAAVAIAAIVSHLF
jgi:chromosome segregation ATPase